MVYISRRVRLHETSAGKGGKSLLTDKEFIELDKHLILLGEPGAGKTSFLEIMRHRYKGQLLFAGDLETNERYRPDHKNQILFVDGLDEILTDTSSRTYSIFKKLQKSGFQKWVITCRSSEWPSGIFEGRIKQFIGDVAIGFIEKMSNEEIMDFVSKSSTHDAQRFLREAQQRGALDMARNPLMLDMLCKTIEDEGWPKNKQELFENACLKMSKEYNPVHQSQNRNRLEPQKIFDISGWICAQLLMSGNQGIDYEGNGTGGFPHIADLSDDQYPTNKLIESISRMLFSPVSTEKSAVEPYHRTIAEYLAARWIVARFKSNQHLLSKKRIETIFISTHGLIPSALRGVYAWIATLDDRQRERWIKNDPYGCLLYGDVSDYSDNEIEFLIKSLIELLEQDPDFYKANQNVDFGRGLFRESMKGRFIKDLTSPNFPKEIKFLILKSLIITDFNECMSNVLTDIVNDIVNDIRFHYALRYEACKALLASKRSKDWQAIIQQLRDSKNYDSLNLVFCILAKKTGLLSGEKIAEVYYEYERGTLQNDHSKVFGIDWPIRRNLCDEQIIGLLNGLTEKLECVLLARDYTRDLAHYLTEFLEMLYERPIDLEMLYEHRIDVIAPRFLRWLKSGLCHFPYTRDGKWMIKTKEFLSDKRELRRSIQSEFLSKEEAVNLDPTLSKILFNLDDISFHAKNLVREKPSNWVDLWRFLIRMTKREGDFPQEVCQLAQEHAEIYPKISDVWKDLNGSPSSEEDHTRQDRIQATRSNIQENDDKRIALFTAVADKMASGENLEALNQAAQAFLGYYPNIKTSSPSHDNSAIRTCDGYYPNIKTSSPRDNLKLLVGEQNTQKAIEGIITASQRYDIPSPKDCISLRVSEDKFYFLESICMARCLLAEESDKSLKDLPIAVLKCALVSCRWGIRDTDYEFLEGMEDKLQAILFRDKDKKLTFVRDTIEPYLEKGKNEYPGFHQVVTGKQFKDIIGKLALDWLSNYPKSSEIIVTNLLKAALQHSPRSSLVDLIRRRVNELEESGDRSIIRQLWLVAGFMANFDHFSLLIREIASLERKNMLFIFKELMLNQNLDFNSKIPPEHLEFLIETFISDWPNNRGFLPVGSNDEESASTASGFIREIIGLLGETSGGLDILEKIKKKSGFAAYERYARGVIARVKRKLTDEQQPVSLEGVRNILLSGKSATIDDLQVIVMEALEDAQNEILTGQTDGYEVFWQGDTSHCENYCRDRLIDKLDPLLGRNSIRVHKEGAMSNERRCDILCTFNDFDLPIEIKGQWHPNLWTAAQEQLKKKYSSGYRSKGRGIYLVLWFGDEIEAKKEPAPIPKDHTLHGNEPASADEMLNLLENYHKGPTSDEICFFVLDVSKKPKNKSK